MNGRSGDSGTQVDLVERQAVALVHLNQVALCFRKSFERSAQAIESFFVAGLGGRPPRPSLGLGRGTIGRETLLTAPHATRELLAEIGHLALSDSDQPRMERTFSLAIESVKPEKGIAERLHEDLLLGLGSKHGGAGLRPDEEKETSAALQEELLEGLLIAGPRPREEASSVAVRTAVGEEWSSGHGPAGPPEIHDSV